MDFRPTPRPPDHNLTAVNTLVLFTALIDTDINVQGVQTNFCLKVESWHTLFCAHYLSHTYTRCRLCSETAYQSVRQASILLAGSQIIQVYNLVKPCRQVKICVCACTVNVCIQVYMCVYVRCKWVHVSQAPWVSKGLLINHSTHCLWIHHTDSQTVPPASSAA